MLAAVLVACRTSEPPPRTDPVPAPRASPPVDAPATTSACNTLVLFVDVAGTWIGAPSDVRCFNAGAPDPTWIRSELARLARSLDAAGCRPVIELGASPGVTYDHIIAAADGVTAAGYRDVDLVAPGSLAMTFGDAPRHPECVGSPDTTKRPQRPRPAPFPRLPKAGPGDPDPPNVLPRSVEISRDAILLDGQRIVGLDAIAQTGPIAELAEALGPAKPDEHALILSAARSTDASLVHRAIETAKGAGYDQLAFAVEVEAAR
jgi:biopolymer transport protein ExbD